MDVIISYDADDIERIGLLRRKPVVKSMIKRDSGSRENLLRKEDNGKRCGKCEGKEVM